MIKMKISELEKIMEELEETYKYVGVRFEDKQREIGEECDFSRHNPNRQDEREFPIYGTEEYDEMEELPGTCAYNFYEFKNNKELIPRNYNGKHCYIIASNMPNQFYVDYAEDDNEVLITCGKVTHIIF